MTSLREELSRGKIRKGWANFVTIQTNPFKKGNIHHSYLASFYLSSILCFLKSDMMKFCALTTHDCYAIYDIMMSSVTKWRLLLGLGLYLLGICTELLHWQNPSKIYIQIGRRMQSILTEYQSTQYRKLLGEIYVLYI